MVEKTFRVISNLGNILTADVISQALLQEITLNPTKPNAVFAVVEEKIPDKNHSQHPESISAK